MDRQAGNSTFKILSDLNRINRYHKLASAACSIPSALPAARLGALSRSLSVWQLSESFCEPTDREH